MLDTVLKKIEKKIISKKNRFKLNQKKFKELYYNFNQSNILVVGASGSIGSEFTKILNKFNFKNLYLIDKNENSLTDLNRDLILIFKKKQILFTRYICADINSLNLSDFIKKKKITHYFNFAAIKHVRSEEELISSKYLFDTNSKNFLMIKKLNKTSLKQVFSISSDKAVEPSSFLGISKKIMEDRLFKFKKLNNSIMVSTVRFANVSFSNGSIFKYAYQRILEKRYFGIPKNIKRYFITHEEAVSLCLHSLTKSSNGYILAPNLTRLKSSISIEKLTIKLLKLFNYKITNKKKLHLKLGNFYVKIVSLTISGQKLYEKLYEDYEKIISNERENLIYIKPNLSEYDPEKLLKNINYSKNLMNIKKIIKTNIKNYKLLDNKFNIKNSI